ncbi:MAG: hypothetical protein ACM34J_03295 [Ignavibacteria bacterium]
MKLNTSSALSIQPKVNEIYSISFSLYLLKIDPIQKEFFGTQLFRVKNYTESEIFHN